MSSGPDPQSQQTAPPYERRAGLAGTRVDPPHTRNDLPPPGAADHLTERPNVPAGGEVCDVLAQVRAQAEQLAAHLSAWQDDLDRREAQANARAADLDNELRAARLWLDEQRLDLAARDDELAGRRRELNELQARLAGAEAARHAAERQAAADMLRREQQLQQKQAQLEARAERIARQEAALAAAQAEWHARREHDRRELAHERQLIDTRRETSLQIVRLALAGLERRRAALDQLDGRGAALEEAELRVAQTQAELLRLQREVSQERERLEIQAAADRQRLAESLQRAEAVVADRQQALGGLAEQLDHRRAALDQSHAAVLHLHREALELKLSAEELHSQLAGPAGASAIGQSLTKLRTRLADSYRLEAEELDRRKLELESLRDELVSHHQGLAERKLAVENWAAGRQRELNEQASMLAARERELERQEARCRELESRCCDERFRLEQKIRRFEAELRGREAARAAADK